MHQQQIIKRDIYGTCFSCLQRQTEKKIVKINIVTLLKSLNVPAKQVKEIHMSSSHPISKEEKILFIR